MWPRYLNVTDRLEEWTHWNELNWTDGQTDRQTDNIYVAIGLLRSAFALRSWRSENWRALKSGQTFEFSLWTVWEISNSLRWKGLVEKVDNREIRVSELTNRERWAEQVVVWWLLDWRPERDTRMFHCHWALCCSPANHYRPPSHTLHRLLHTHHTHTGTHKLSHDGPRACLIHQNSFFSAI